MATGPGRAFALAVLLAACSAAPGAVATISPSPALTASAAATPSPSAPTASPTPTATAECAARVLARMTMDQRIGQLFLLGLADDQLGAAERDAIRTQHFGSVWFVERSTAGAATSRAVADAVQALATADATAEVRFFVAANQEGGLIQSLSGPGFTTIPSALDQSAVDPATLRAQAVQWGRELQGAGVNLNFAPVLDVVPPDADSQNEPIGVLRRGYGHDPATVSAHGLAFLRGMDDAGIATTAKHFPGLGRVKGNTDFTAAVVDTETTATDPYLAPFRDAIAAGVPFVMVALATYTRIDGSTLAAFSPAVIRQLLRASLAFDGVVVSDDLGATAAVASIAPSDRAIGFLSAGGDLIISKTIAPARAMAAGIRARVAADAAFSARVDDAVLRVLRVKAARGLIACARV
jgi:beta-N-acetylhexosaminidase